MNDKNNLDHKEQLLTNFSKDFFDETFLEIQKNVECYAFSGFEGTPLFSTMESFVCQTLLKVYEFDQVATNKSLILLINEPVVRNVFDKTIDVIFQTHLKNATKDNIIDHLSAHETLRNMTKKACDNIFELEKEDQKQATTNDINKNTTSKIKAPVLDNTEF